jgi:type IV pilus assembly protein PilV
MQVQVKNKNQSSGFTLLEIMVALLIISIGLLGVATLQVRGQQFNQAAYLRTQATFLAYDLMDRMRANRVKAIQGRYAKQLPINASEECDATACTTTQLINYDLDKWFAIVQETLPKGKAKLDWNDPTYTITIQWMSIIDDGKQQEEQQWIFQP